MPEGGIWRLDLESQEAVRLWPYNTEYALSPDQRQIVIIAREEVGDAVRTYPVIADVPSHVSNPFDN